MAEPGERGDVELRSRRRAGRRRARGTSPDVPKPALLTTRSIGQAVSAIAGRDRSEALRRGEVGGEHLDARRTGRRARRAGRARRATTTVAMPGLGEQLDHRLADAAGRTGDERGREREGGWPSVSLRSGDRAGRARSVRAVAMPPGRRRRQTGVGPAECGSGLGVVLVAQQLLGPLLGRACARAAVDLLGRARRRRRGCSPCCR